MTCRQVYRSTTIYELAKAMEAKYDKVGAPKFWRSAAYDNLSGVLADRGDLPGALEVVQKRLALVRGEYRAELLSGTKRADIRVTRDLVNVLINIAGGLTQTRTGSPENVKMILDEAERYADQKRPRDGGYLCAIIWRQRALLEKETGDDDEAFRLMQKATAILCKDPSFTSSINGIRTQWDFADMMMLANDGSKIWESHELKEETLATAQRVLGSDHPFVVEKGAELNGFKERMGEEWFSFGRAFRGEAAAAAASSTDKVLATGFCYTGQRAKITGVTDEGYRGLLSEEDGSWGVAFIPLPAVCLDKGTRIVLQGYLAKHKRLNGKSGVVEGYEFENNELRNFDALRLQVDVDGAEDQLLVKNPRTQWLKAKDVDTIVLIK